MQLLTSSHPKSYAQCGPSGTCGPMRGTSPDAIDATLAFLALEITQKCNLRCVHCYASSSPELPLRGRMTYDDWKEVLRDAATLGCRHVQFIGGEPTLHPDLISLIQDAREFGFLDVEVYTNGTLLTSGLIEVFRTHNVKLAFSFYASDSTIHDTFTARVGSHSKVVDAIRRAVEAKIDVRVGVVLAEINEHGAAATVQLLKDLGVKTIHFDRVRSFGRGGALSKKAINSVSELCGECGNKRIAIDADGEIFPCVFSKSYSIGNVAHGLKSALQGLALKQFRGRLLATKSDRCASQNSF
ncbi:MAG: radical [Verrucomicrobiales bacterium]|nr:radical [Verrucomicrobiales bacterium]